MKGEIAGASMLPFGKRASKKSEVRHAMVVQDADCRMQKVRRRRKTLAVACCRGAADG